MTIVTKINFDENTSVADTEKVELIDFIKNK